MVVGFWLLLGDGSGNATASSSSGGVADHQPPAGTDMTVVAAACGGIGFVLAVIAAWVLYRVAFMDPQDATEVAAEDDGAAGHVSTTDTGMTPSPTVALNAAALPMVDGSTPTIAAPDWADDPDRVLNPCNELGELPVPKAKRTSLRRSQGRLRSTLEGALLPSTDGSPPLDDLSTALLNVDPAA